MTESSQPQEKNQAQIDVIKDIFNKLKIGHSCNSIAKALNNKGVPSPRTGSWNATAVRRIAENPLYAGILVTGRTRKKNNPLTETDYSEELPVDEWFCSKDIHASPYKVIEAKEWAEVQKKLITNRKKRVNGGRPPATFGPSLLSGLLFCWHCGSPLVNGRGGKKRSFRCSHRRFKKGDPRRCDHTFTIREDEFTHILYGVIQEILKYMLPETLRIINEEIQSAGGEFEQKLEVKIREFKHLKRREETLLELHHRAIESASTERIEDIANRLFEIGDRTRLLEKEIEHIRSLSSIAKKSLIIDENALNDCLFKISSLLSSSNEDEIVQLRTAIKSFLPKIFIKVENCPGSFKVIYFRIEQIPDNLVDFLQGTHTFVVAHKQKTTNINRIVSLNENLTDPISKVYEYLSNTYVSDKYSYTHRNALPMYWQILIPYDDKQDCIYYTMPFSVIEFGPENDDLLFGS